MSVIKLGAPSKLAFARGDLDLVMGCCDTPSNPNNGKLGEGAAGWAADRRARRTRGRMADNKPVNITVYVSAACLVSSMHAVDPAKTLLHTTKLALKIHAHCVQYAFKLACGRCAVEENSADRHHDHQTITHRAPQSFSQHPQKPV
eukprot:1160804-Pelagomonas_calceolata.AAC.2